MATPVLKCPPNIDTLTWQQAIRERNQ